VARKQQIIDSLGEQQLLLPSRVNAGLAANDRAKYLLTLLQAARAHGEDPSRWATDLRSERLACGIDDERLDGVVAAAEKLRGDTMRIPGVRRILDQLYAEVEAMIAPLDSESASFIARLRAQRDAVAPCDDDTVTGRQVQQLAQGERERGDSVHIIVMDAHKALNRLQARIATESIDGASAYGLADSDRPLVAAFMAGVNRTAPLKFDHPGLGTTATRADGRLVIQNDIGTTDAHVLVVHVDGLGVTLTYTDVHLQRLLFLQRLFRRWNVAWDDTRLRRDDDFEDGAYHLCTGRFEAPHSAALAEYLSFLGSRLVFLIDWNRARKRLRTFVAKPTALDVLQWAADNDVGHMGFLCAGGEQLIYDAIEFAFRGQTLAGRPLHELLGEAAASDYLRFVLRTCAQALLRSEPESFVQDAVRAELLNHVRSSQQELFDVASEHASWVVELAAAVRDGILQWRLPDAQSRIKQYSSRAKEWETRADELVNRARNAERPGDSSSFFRGLLESADDIADELEDAVFHLTLLPPSASQHVAYAPLRNLSQLVVQGAQEYLKAMETARHVRRGGAREDTSDFLDAIHRIMLVERRSDEAQREVERALTQVAGDFRALYMTAEAAKNLEQAADALMHCGLQMRDHVMRDVLAA
jgi:uncharacterized protein Yka (UPF0111/DUF47 family)